MCCMAWPKTEKEENKEKRERKGKNTAVCMASYVLRAKTKPKSQKNNIYIFVQICIKKL